MTQERPRRPPTPEEARAARLEDLARRRAAQPPLDRPAPHRPAPDRPAADRPAPAGPPRWSRRHPAQAARYAAAGLSIVSTIGLTSLFTREAGGSQQQVSAAAVVSGSATTTTALDPSTTTQARSATTIPTTTTTAARRRSSVVDGAVFQNRYGNVQVEATFAADGSLASVTALQSPNDRGRSVEINDYAVPQLNDEAVSLQSANVHTVSGATYTSTDYRRSLQSAIDAARAASLTQLS